MIVINEIYDLQFFSLIHRQRVDSFIGIVLKLLLRWRTDCIIF